MTLHIHRAARSDRLVDALGELLADPLGDVFATEIVSVPTQGVERWLSQRLSHRLGAAAGAADGVCSGIDFSSPRRVLARAVVADSAAADADPWRPERMVWPLLEVIDNTIGAAWCAPLARYLGATDSAPGAVDAEVRRGRRYATAQHLAELYAGYAASRPEMIESWIAGRLVDGAGRPLTPDLAWQAELWRRLRGELDLPSPAERISAACQLLVSQPDRVDLPRRLSIFGPTRLPPDQLEVVAALAAGRDVHLWLAHPSAALWQSVAGRLAGADGPTGRRALPRRQDPTAELPTHRLLSYLGRDAREFQWLLHNAGAPVHDQLLSVDTEPATTLLGRLQADIAADRAPAAPNDRPVLEPEDFSIEIHASHGPDRQVEVLRELLLGLLASDPTLEPRDIVVMCPDIETFAPLISASFGLQVDAVDGAHPASQLRVRLADRSLRQLNPLLATLSRLLELADSRLVASDVLDLCGYGPITRKFGLNEDDQARIRDLVIRSGVRWGLDADHRQAFGMGSFPQNTWSAGLARLLLGVTMSEDGQHFLGTALPLDDVDSADVELVGKLAELLDRLQTSLAGFNRRQPLTAWVTALRAALDSLTAVPAADAWQISHAYAELAALPQAAEGTDGRLDLSLIEVRTLLAEVFKGRPSRANFRTGTLTMCTMMPMRSVPHRVICLLGLDDGVFPRTGALDGDDILALEPCIGDRDRRSEDRQLLLDAIMAAGDRLIIIYSGADPRINAPKPPAVPLGELLDTLDATARTGDGGRIRDRLVIRHPLQPFDAANFRPAALRREDKPFSFDRAALAAAITAAGPRHAPRPLFPVEPLPPVAVPEVIQLSDLTRFFNHPVRAYLRHRGGLLSWSGEDDSIDNLPVELDGLQAWAIGDRLLRLRLAGVPASQAIAAEWRRGELPPQRFGVRTLSRVAETVDQIAAASAAFLTEPSSSHDVLASLGSHTVSGTLGNVRGHSLVTVHYSRLAPKHRLQAWIELLALTATRPDQPLRAVVVGRGGLSVLGPIPDRFAVLVLADLVDLYRLGLSEPLPLAPRPAAEYARIRLADRPVAPFLPKIGELWDSERDEAYGRFFPDTPLTELLKVESVPAEERGSTREPSRFGTLARRVWQPLLSNEVLD